MPDRVASTVAVCALEETWKNEEDALLAVVLRVVAPEGRLGSSLSLVCSRSLLLIPNERLDAFFVSVRCLSSYELVDGRFWWYAEAWGTIEETSMEGMWMHSKPVFVSRYCTCMRSRTRLMSAWMTLGGFVDVVATLITE